MNGAQLLREMKHIESAHRRGDLDVESLARDLIEMQTLLKNAGISKISEEYHEATIRYNGLLHIVRNYVEAGTLATIN
jgi:hypothetical protein